MTVVHPFLGCMSLYVCWILQRACDRGYNLGSALPIIMIILNNHYDIYLGHAFKIHQHQFIWNIINISPWSLKITIMESILNLL